METIGILAYGSLIEDPGGDMSALIIDRINTTTPFSVEFARKSATRNGAPTLIPFLGGLPVKAQILVLNKTISAEQAVNILYQRETRQQRRNYTRPDEQDINANTVVIETLKHFQGIDMVFYTKIGANIENMTPLFLAELAIDSARSEAGANKMDGISYLIDAKRNGIKTAMSGEYERQILILTGTTDLVAAHQHCRKNFVKINVSMFIPALIELTEGIDIPWDRIDRLFREEIKARKRQANDEIITIDASIFDAIVEAKKGNKIAIGYLDFLNKLFQEITDNLAPGEKQHIQTNITKMLTTFDKAYWGYVAELATLNNLLKSKTYKIVGSEIRLPDTKPIDFKFTTIKNGKEIYAEIYSIHIDDERLETDPQKMKAFLHKRISDKIEDKHMDFQKYPNLYLVTVLWGTAASLKPYSDFFKKHSLGLTNVLEPISYVTYSAENGYYIHEFKTISHLSL